MNIWIYIFFLIIILLLLSVILTLRNQKRNIFLRSKNLEKSLVDLVGKSEIENNEMVNHLQNLEILLNEKDEALSIFAKKILTPLYFLISSVNSLIEQENLKQDQLNLLFFVRDKLFKLEKISGELKRFLKRDFNVFSLEVKPLDLLKVLDEIVEDKKAILDKKNIKVSFLNSEYINIPVLLDYKILKKVLDKLLCGSLIFSSDDSCIKLSVIDIENDICISLKFISEFDLKSMQDANRIDIEFPVIDNDYCYTEFNLIEIKELASNLGGEVDILLFDNNVCDISLKFDKKSISINFEFGYNNELVKNEYLKKVNSSNVLIVSESVDLFNYLKIVLMNYNTKLVDNTHEAIDILEGFYSKNGDGTKEFYPDIIIIESLLPDSVGFELLDFAKNNFNFKNIPFFVISTFIDSKMKFLAYKFGVTDFLILPFGQNEIESKIEDIMRKVKMGLGLDDWKLNGNGHTENIVFSEFEREWILNVKNLFINKLSDDSYKMEFAAREFNLSNRQFSRKIKKITGLTSAQYFQELKLLKAREYLFSGKYSSVKQVSFAVGYRNTKYFSNIFKNRFGRIPSDYIK